MIGNMELTTLHPLIQRVLSPGAPLPLRLAAARGNVPVPRAALLPALVRLTRDEADEVREAAIATLAGIGDTDLLEALAEPRIDDQVLEYTLSAPGSSRDVLLAAMTHPAVTVESLLRIADCARPEALDILVENQERLIRTPELVARLVSNPSLSGLQRSRLADFREQFYFLKSGVAGAAVEQEPGLDSGSAPALPGPGAIEEEGGAPLLVTDEEVKALLREVGDLPFLSVDLPTLLDSDGLSGEGIEETVESDPLLQSVWNRLLKMNGVGRLRAALRGGREERAILIRDKNRIIAAAVLKNPRITELEVAGFAAVRSLNEDLLRMIGMSREWMKSYAVLHQLVRNPKTPAGIAMGHVKRLVSRDLQNLTRDKNIAEIVRRTARHLLDQRANPQAAAARGKH